MLVYETGSSVSVFLFNGKPGSGPGPHRHPYDEIQLIREGRGVGTVSGKTFEGSAGDIFVIKAGEISDQAGYKLPIDDRILADTDTLMVFGLDHLISEQDAGQEEIAAVRKWLEREGTCLLLGPHHDVGFTEDLKQRQQEYLHHGDALVPRQQRFGQYTRSMMKGLGVPVMNQFGLRPALVKGTRQIAPLTINRDLDELGLLNGVTTFKLSSSLATLCVDRGGCKIGPRPHATTH
jgi:hypothetical protein